MGETVHELVRQRAAARPGATAVVAADATLTYAQLDATSNALAHRLRGHGVGPEVIVGVLAGRTAAMVVAVLGVLKAGGAYLPLDPDYPPERLAFMVDDAGLDLIVAAPGQRARVPAFTGTVVTMGAGAADEPPAVTTHPGNLAYVVYTSGSTGRPKGVLLHHGGLANLVHEQVERFGLDPTSRVLQLASFSFDASVSETFTTLCAGATLVLADRADVGAALDRHRITTFTVVPSTLATIERVALPDLATIVVAGEACTAAVVQPWVAAGRRVLNAYGPSEATVCATMSGPLDGQGPPPLGQPLGGLSVHVLDDALLPTEEGQLFVGGAGVARGYLGRPGLTAERFLPDPWAAQPGARMYATGDVVRVGPEGALHFVGRADDQVKVRGVRIELGEVEAALASAGGVRAAAAAVHGDRLVGYVVAEPGIDVAAIRHHVAAHVPQHAIPRAVVVLDALPVTPNGKVDRAALPPPDQQPAPAPSTPPRTDTEARLAAIWADLLGTGVGVHDDFFDLGGDSLLAAAVVARVADEIGVDLTLGQVVAQPTVAGLAALVAIAPQASAAKAIEPAPDGPVPLSPAQARLWFLEQLHPGASAYNVPVAVALPPGIDQATLRQRLDDLAARHPILTSRVVMHGGAPHQEVVPGAVIPLAWSQAPSGATEFARQPFALTTGPLLRAAVWTGDGGTGALLCLSAHHIAVDGLSVERILSELLDRPSASPAIQFRDVAAWQSAQSWDRGVAWWAERLAGAPDDLGLATDHSPPPGRARRGEQVAARIDGATAAALRAVARGQGTTSFSALVAGFAALVVRYGGTDDVVVGSPFAGRLRAEWEDVVGCFVNTVVLRTDCSGNPTFAALVGRAGATVTDAWAHQDVPFERLVAALAPARDARRNPLFQAMVAVERAPRAGQVDLDLGTARFDLELVVRDEGNAGLGVTLRYDADVFDRATATGLAHDYATLLAAAARHPDVPISDLDLGVPRPPAPKLVAPPTTVVDLLADLAARQPDAPAVLDGGHTLTYRELWERAGALMPGPAGPGAVVGVCMERSADAVVAWLGVMRSGAAYLPLDPDYPPERLAWMVADAGVTAAVVGPGLDDRLPAHVELIVPGNGAPDTSPHPDDVAYVIYTSGSTGQPKGVQITHRALADFACWYRDTYAVTPADRATILGPLSFDISVLELWPYLVAGASVAVAPDEARLVPSALGSWLARSGVTIATLVTPLCEAAVESGHLADAPALRLVHTGGDRLTRRPPRDATYTLVNNYGPTECTVAATSGVVAASTGPADALPDLGHPLGPAAAYVLDRWDNPVPAGAIGELYVGGPSLARGYLGRPALTAERFLPDPFSPHPGARMYRTGDRVRLRPDGRLDFLGRVDQQIKLRGHRIEPAEIEAALLTCPGVQAAAVTVHGPTPARQRLVGYLVAGAQATTTDAELRAQLEQSLPAFMVPAQFVRLGALPTLPSGKVDRSALPTPPERPRPAPFTGSPVEQAIAGIWKAILDTDVGIDDNFFDLGGTSLLLARVQAELAAQLHLEVSIQDLFHHPTVAALARHIWAKEDIAEPQSAGSGRRPSQMRATAALRRGKRSEGGEFEQERLGQGATET
jgi:amino acid adenylation domain-containing protein